MAKMRNKKPKSKSPGAVADTSNRPTLERVFTIVSLTLVMIISVGIGYYIKENLISNRDCSITIETDRFNCIPEGNASMELCQRRGCCWQPTKSKAPSCYFPHNYGYEVLQEPDRTSTGIRMPLKRLNTATMFGDDIENITLLINMQTDYRLQFKLLDSDKDRYEVPLQMPTDSLPAQNPEYLVSYTKSPFSLRIARKATETVILDTSVGALVYSDQFLQISYLLASNNIYGFGEHRHQRYKHDVDWRKWGMFAHSYLPNCDDNLYGQHPFYMVLENDGNAHGVFLRNSNAMDITLQPMPALTWRTIGGVLDFWVFLGPTPEDVIQQYHQAIGTSAMPPYWSLGFQLARWEYNSLDKMKSVTDRTRRTGIPFDVQWADIDYMQRNLDFTYNKEKFTALPEFVKEIHAQGQKFMIILDPAIGINEPPGSYPPFSEGKRMGVFINESDGTTPCEGKVWPGMTYFPDYTNPATQAWWSTQCKRFHDIIPYDGLWIDMNEPSNFKNKKQGKCKKNKWNYPPYIPKIKHGYLASKTLCMDTVQYAGRHYDVHSLYGDSMGRATKQAMNDISTKKRPFILSRSTFAGSGQYVAHWLGDNNATWEDMHDSIPGILEFNLFGIPMVGADICGFFSDVDDQLCQRWMQLGAFYPFSRNHNARKYKDQDPGAFSLQWQMSAVKVMKIRYSLLPYLYTLFYHSHISGGTVARPLLHEFPTDKETWDIDTQFLWGSALMICPILKKDVTSINVYFPRVRWYDFYTGIPLPDDWSGHYQVNAAPDRPNLYIRGGTIIPTQEPANTTVYSRLNTMGLIIALPEDPSDFATGDLFWDDGESADSIGNNDLYIEFQASFEIVIIALNRNYYLSKGVPFYGHVTLYGIPMQPAKVLVNGNPLDGDSVFYDADTYVLKVDGFFLPINDSHVISIKY